MTAQEARKLSDSKQEEKIKLDERYLQSKLNEFLLRIKHRADAGYYDLYWYKDPDCLKKLGELGYNWDAQDAAEDFVRVFWNT